jgi:ribosomal protein S27E
MKKTKTKTRGNYKKLACKYCESIVERVDKNSIAVTCSKCTFKLCEGIDLDISE